MHSPTILAGTLAIHTFMERPYWMQTVKEREQANVYLQHSNHPKFKFTSPFPEDKKNKPSARHW